MHLLDSNGNPKYTNLMRDEVSSKSVVRGVGGQISSNVQSYTFSVGPHQRWKPELSSWVMRIAITQNDGTQLAAEHDIAPAINCALNGWQYIHCYAGNQKIDELSEHVAEVSSIRTRLEKSKSWFDAVGEQQFWDSSYEIRQNKLISDAVDTTTSLATNRLIAADLYDIFQVTAPNQIAAANVGVFSTLTFTINGGNAIPDLTLLDLQQGDQITLGAAMGGANPGRIVTITNIAAAVLTVTPQIAAFGAQDVAPLDLINVSRISRVPANVTNLISIVTGRDEYEIQFKLPLGICYLSEMPTGEYEFRLRGFSYQEFAKRFIESLVLDKTVVNANVAIALNQFRLEVKDFYYYPYFVEAPTRLDDGIITKTFKCYEAQKKKILSDSNQLQFTIKGNSSALGFAVQDGRIGNDSRYSASRMVAYNNIGIPPSGVGLEDDNRIDTKISYYQIKYANKYKPEPAQQDDLGAAAPYRVFRIVQSYYDTFKNSGAFFYDGVMETISDYLMRGPIYFWQFPRDRNTYATEARIDLKFRQDPGSNVNCVFFYCFYRTIKLTIKDGRIVSVDKNI